MWLVKMNIRKEINKIKAGQKRPDGIFGSFMTRTVSHYFAFGFFKIGFSPNLVSFLSLVLCAISAALIVYNRSMMFLIIAAAIWWLGAILDAADGDLARYINVRSKFGGWFDSFLDRCKEFLIFAVFGSFAWIDYANPLFLLLGILSIYSNVMSGYVSDTKKLFLEGKRSPSVKFGKKFIFGMVDTRDFVVILSLLAGDFRIALFAYGTIFVLIVLAQIIMFCRRFGSVK